MTYDYEPKGWAAGVLFGPMMDKQMERASKASWKTSKRQHGPPTDQASPIRFRPGDWLVDQGVDECEDVVAELFGVQL